MNHNKCPEFCPKCAIEKHIEVKCRRAHNGYRLANTHWHKKATWETHFPWIVRVHINHAWKADKTKPVMG